MKNFVKFLGVIAFVAIIGFSFVACGGDDDSSSSSSEADTWSDVTSLTQLNGTWKGSLSETETFEEYGITVNQSLEMTVTINATSADEGTMSTTMKMTMTFSGDGIDDVWQDLMDILEIDEDDPEVTVDNSKHSVSVTENIPAESITLSEMKENVKINQNGTKVKATIDGEDGPEIIMVKQ